jgi:hypothetical protein
MRSFKDILDSVCGADDPGVTVLPLRRPHRDVGEEPAIGMFECQERVGNITSIINSFQYQNINVVFTRLDRKILTLSSPAES